MDLSNEQLQLVVEMACPRLDLGSLSVNPQCRTSSVSRQKQPVGLPEDYPLA
jgi:hypothetical protein